MPLTDGEIHIISQYPLNNTLDRFQPKLRDLHNAGPRQEDITSLLGVLVVSPAAFHLTSHGGNGYLAAGILSIAQLVLKGEAKLDQFSALARHVSNKSSDDLIWAAVFNLVDTLTPSPSSIVPASKRTLEVSSSSLADSEARDLIERELFEEISESTFRNVGGFCDKFFDSKSWRRDQREMLEKVLAEHDGKKWIGFPSTADERYVWDWLRSLEARALVNARHQLYTATTADQFKERKGQMDIFFQKTQDTNTNSRTFEYKDVLVVGVQKKFYDKSRFQADLLQLTRYVRGVFTDQPTRRFVHGFILCASTIEFLVFDRSGAYSSGLFDIHDEPDKFARAITGYATMNDHAMGLDTFIEREHGHFYVTLDDATDNSNETRIRLKRPIVRQKAIVCRGTTCFETRNNHVAKFSWASDKRKLEVEHLKSAEEKGVQGVVRVVAHRQITTIAELREGLGFHERHRFRNEVAHFNQPLSAIAGISTSINKRKSSFDHTSDNVSEFKRLRSGSSDHSSDNASGVKRLRSSGHNSKQAQNLDSQLSIDDAQLSSSKDSDLWENRIFSCLVISPAGRVLGDFTTTKELLESLRDAIRAHQSLYITGNILHRDISSNNIMITKPEEADGFKGMLIDLDLAKVRDSGPSGARHLTGTIQFMAVEVLRMADHTYRHDLESFFYVLLWMCARQSWSNGFTGEPRSGPPTESLLRKWEIGSFKDIARTKEGDMTVNGLERIMGEFPGVLDVVKPLCLKIRKILFPLDPDERMSFGTPAGDPDHLYRPIIASYDDAISNL